MAGRTTILITHDLRLTAIAGRVPVLSDGRIAGHGTHHDLLAGNGPYRGLHGLTGSRST